MKPKFSAAVVGCGKIAGRFEAPGAAHAYSHAAAFAGAGYRLAACVDADPARAAELAALHGYGSAHSDLAEALAAAKPDVVSVCTPDATHHAVAMAVLESPHRPRVVFLEKPACANRAQAEELIAASRRAGVPLVVNHSRRFDTSHEVLRGIIQSREWGRLVLGDVFYYGGWEHNGIHAVDTLAYVFQTRPEVRVTGRGVADRSEEDPTLEVCVMLPSQEAPVYFHPFDERYYQIFEMDFKFESARLRIEDFGARWKLERKSVNTLRENVLTLQETDLGGGLHSPMETAARYLAQYLESGDPAMLEGFTLEAVLPAMEAVWEGREEYASKFKSP